MKTMKRFLSMAALALAGAIITACSGSDDGIDTPQQPANTGKVVTLTTTVGLAAGDGTEAGAGDGSGTRALTIDYENKQCVKTFAERDHIAVIYKNTSGETVMAESEELTAEEIAADGKSTNFTVTLTDPDYDAPIRYIYPAAMAKFDIDPDATIDDEGTVDFDCLHNEQAGDLEELGNAFDLCTFDADDWTSGELPSGTLENKLAILALTLKDDIRNVDITGSITGLTISDGTNSYTINTINTYDYDHIYVVIRPTDNADITVTATDGTSNYTKSLTGKSYLAGNIYNVSWRMTNTMQLEPLTMEALTGSYITVSNPRSGMQYSKNGGEKITMSSTTTIPVSAGDKVRFYGNGTSITCYDGTNIAGTAEVKVYGNIMSLVDEENFATNTTLTSENTFWQLFNGNDKLKDASGLLLPATTLTQDCYNEMFYDCRWLTAAPALPATTLAEACYNGMFCWCSRLTTAPALPATTLAEGCYSNMFSYCSGLTTAPVLPATTLADDCYKKMFYQCYNLSSVTCLATDISALSCTTNWLDGVAASGTFTKNPSMTGWSTGTNGIPSGWTVEDYVAPSN